MEPASANHGGEASIPLCVDLDDTLVCTDLLWEQVVRLWRHPVVAFQALRALLGGGKAAFKAVLAEAIPVDPAILPYRKEVLEFVVSQRALGREVILATASHRIVAERVAGHLQLFSSVLATESAINLSGGNKRSALERACGRNRFDYIGDSRKDLDIFAASRHAYLVNPSASLLKKASANGNVERIFTDERMSAAFLAKTLRLHQWAKNALLAVPLLTAHLVFDLQAWAGVAIAFIGFSLLASATYLINDLVDLNSDRIHPQKRMRPLASGRLSIGTGLVLALVLGSSGFLLSAALLPASYSAYLLAYVALTLGYSLVLKRRLLVDVVTLAVLYTVRILAGGAAIGVVVSEWLLMFSLFVFLSLAFLKRAVELGGAHGKERIAGRGYSSVDVETIRSIGVSSGLASVLVLALYINSPAVSQLYRAPQMLWFMCPLLIYWISRMWFLAARGEVDHDPVVFALRDLRSYAVGACGVMVAVLAKIGPMSLWW